MIIRIEDLDYLLISSDKPGISLDLAHPDLPAIYAHAQISLEEVKAFIRNHRKKLPVDNNENKILEFIQIQLFDQSYPVRIERKGIQQPYFKNNIIHYSTSLQTNIHSSHFVETLKQICFEQIIFKFVGLWEEEFNILCQRISFRKMKTSSFITDPIEKTICFNKNNLDFTERINNYLVFLAMIELAGINVLNEKLLKKHFPDYERLNKYIANG